MCEPENLVVANARRNFSDGHNIVTCRAKGSNHGKVAAFVRDKTHFYGFEPD
jgi:hypothetical protein